MKESGDNPRPQRCCLVSYGTPDGPEVKREQERRRPRGTISKRRKRKLRSHKERIPQMGARKSQGRGLVNRSSLNDSQATPRKLENPHLGLSFPRNSLFITFQLEYYEF